MPTSLDPEIGKWLESLNLTTRHITERSWDHAESAVYQIDENIVKVFNSKRKFIQELRFYDHYAPFLKQVPNLLASHEQRPFAIVCNALPGTLSENLTQTEDMYLQAGRWLKQLHQLPCQTIDNMPLGQALTKRAQSWLQRAKNICDQKDLTWAASLIETFKNLNHVQRVPCHRDYTARNWMWHNNTLQVIDFERSNPDWYLLDCERLISGIFRQKPKLGQAFFRGYGHSPNDTELEILFSAAVISAISTIVWATEHQDQAFKQDGLARLQYYREQGQIDLGFM